MDGCWLAAVLVTIRSIQSRQTHGSEITNFVQILFKFWCRKRIFEGCWFTTAALDMVNDKKAIQQAEALILPLGGSFFNQLTKQLGSKSAPSSRRCLHLEILLS